MKKSIIFVWIFLMLLLGLTIGEFHRGLSPKVIEKEINVNESCIKNYEGLRFVAENNKEVVNKVTDEYDKYGDWICVNIKDMDYERAIEVCKHETFHEIWAECGESNNLTYCIEEHDKEKLT